MREMGCGKRPDVLGMLGMACPLSRRPGLRHKAHRTLETWTGRRHYPHVTEEKAGWERRDNLARGRCTGREGRPAPAFEAKSAALGS